VRKVIVSQFVTLDGVMEDPGGSEGFDRGGWAFQFDRGPEGNKFKLDEVMASEALLLGRVTYLGFAEAWPSRTGDFADKFNSMPKIVVSTTLEEAEWSNSTVIKGNVAEEVSRLKEQSGGDILVNGSPRARADADGARPRRRVPAHGLPDRFGKRQASLRRRERDDRPATGGRQAGRSGRRRHPHV
jgi:dihydrofolate reductase